MFSDSGVMKTVMEMLKPLIREIHLFDTFVAGTTHLQDQSVFQEIRIGDKLSLQREDNKFDDNAVLILTETGKKLGYIPELLVAKITKIETRGSFYQISIGIFLVDF